MFEFIKCIKSSAILGKYLIINSESTLSDSIVKIVANALEFVSHVDKRSNISFNICLSRNKIKMSRDHEYFRNCIEKESFYLFQTVPFIFIIFIIVSLARCLTPSKKWSIRNQRKVIKLSNWCFSKLMSLLAHSRLESTNNTRLEDIKILLSFKFLKQT